MKKKQIILKIEHPCNADWNSFSQKDYGGYCSHCCKTVIDFTGLSDSELYQVFSKPATKICGRFNSAQLNRVIPDGTVSHNSITLNKILAALLIVGATQNRLTNEVKASNIQTIASVREKRSGNAPQPIKSSNVTKDSANNFIEGRVVDENANPIPFVQVLLKDTKYGILTDKDGKFKLFIPDSYTQNKITIKISAVGYEGKEYYFKRSSLPVKKKLVIKMDMMMMGEVVITTSVE